MSSVRFSRSSCTFVHTVRNFVPCHLWSARKFWSFVRLDTQTTQKVASEDFQSRKRTFERPTKTPRKTTFSCLKFSPQCIHVVKVLSVLERFLWLGNIFGDSFHDVSKHRDSNHENNRKLSSVVYFYAIVESINLRLTFKHFVRTKVSRELN